MILFLPILALLLLAKAALTQNAEVDIPALPKQADSVKPPKLSWKGEFPSNYIVIPEDEIKFPLDDYVTMTGASFSGPSGSTMSVINKIDKWNAFKYSEGEFQNCIDSFFVDGDEKVVVMLCGKNIVKLYVDPKSGDYKKMEKLTLETEKIPSASLNCFHLSKAGTEIFVSCNSIAAKDFSIVGFRITKELKKKQVIVFNDKEGKYKTNRPLVIKRMAVKDSTLYLIHSVGDIKYKSGSLSFLRCHVMKSDTKETTNAVCGDPVDIFSTITPYQGGVIKYVDFIQKGIVVGVALIKKPKEANTNSRAFGFVFVALNGLEPVKPIVKNLSPINGDEIPNFDQFKMAVTQEGGNSNAFIAADTANIYYIPYKQDSKGALTLSKPIVNSIECGVSADSGDGAPFAHKVLFKGKKFNSLTSRVMVTYSASSASADRVFKPKQFAIYFNAHKYGCSNSNKGLSSAALSFATTEYGFFFSDRNIQFVKFSPDTFLSIKIKEKEEAGEKKLAISSKIGSADAINKEFKYTYSPSVKDYNKISIPNKQITAYGDSFFLLPVSQASFVASAPQISASVEGKSENKNIQVRHSTITKLKIKNVDTSDDFLIDRIYSVDSDTFLAVQKKDKENNEAFSLIFTKVNEKGELTYTASANKTVIQDKHYVFQTFKIGPEHFCIILKSLASPKIKFVCYEDKKDGKQVKINVADNNGKLDPKDEREMFDKAINDVRILEFSNRAEIIAVTTADPKRKLRYFWVEISGKKEITCADASSVLDSKMNSDKYENMEDYEPHDIMYDFWGDKDSSTYMTIKMGHNTRQPIIAKFQISFANNKPSLSFINYMKIPSLDLSFCSIKDEIILYNHKQNKITARTWVKSATGALGAINNFEYPLKSYGFAFINNFICIPEKATFQILATASDKVKYMATFRGGDSNIAPRRVHSIVQVETESDFIETGTSFEQIVTVIGRAGGGDVERSFVVTYPEGPLISVDNKGIEESYNIIVKSDTKGKGDPATEKLAVTIISPMLSPKIGLGSSFEVKVNSTVDLDQMTQIEGPVMDIKAEGEVSGLTLVKRMNSNKRYKTAEAKTADRIFVVREFLVSYYKDQNKIIFTGNPTMTKNTGLDYPSDFLTVDKSALNGKDIDIKDLQVKPKGTGREVLVCIKAYSNKKFVYILYILSSYVDSGTIKYKASKPSTYEVNIDYDSMQMTPVGEDYAVFALRNKKNWVSNYIKLVCLKLGNDGRFTQEKAGRAYTTSHDDIGYYSIVDGTKNTAVIISQFAGQPGFIAARWNLEDAKDLKSPFIRYQGPLTFGTESKSVVFKFMKCLNKEDREIECFIDSEGINDHLINIVLGDPHEKDSKIIEKPTVKQEFIMPPKFEIQRVDRAGDYYGFLLKRSAINSKKETKKITEPVAADFIDNIDDCNNIIAIYKKDEKYLHTGITCSQFGPAESVDFAMESDGKEFIYHTLTPFPEKKKDDDKKDDDKKDDKKAESRRVLATGDKSTISSNFVSPIMITFNKPVDTSNVKLSFIGLKGTKAADEDNTIKLSEFEKGKPPTKSEEDEGGLGFWGWLLIFLLIIGLLVGGFFAWKWWSNRQSTASASSYSKANNNLDSGSDALHDERL